MEKRQSLTELTQRRVQSYY